MNIHDLQKEVHAINVEKGWHDAPLREVFHLPCDGPPQYRIVVDRVLAKLALVHSEFCEAEDVVARPGAVLIDDSPAHCDAWEAEGGRAILFPGYGNAKHSRRERPLPDVLARLEIAAAQSERAS